MKEDWQLNHLGMIAKSKNKVLHHFHELGLGVSVGPQPLLPHIEGEAYLKIDQTMAGDPIERSFPTPGPHTFFDGQSQIGDLQLEVIQPVPGTFLYDYQDAKGDGINHLCFNVEDIEGVTQRFTGLGCREVFCSKTGGQIVENYLDLREFGDVILSFRPPAAGFEKAWQANNQAHPKVWPWRFFGLGIAVKDAVATARYYEGMGFDVEERGEGRSAAGVGPVTFEFIGPKAGEDLANDALNARGEGIYRLDFQVEDIDAEKERLVAALPPGLLGEGPERSLTIDASAIGSAAIRLVEG